MDERPAPRFAVGQMVMRHTVRGEWDGPYAVTALCWSASDPDSVVQYTGWFYDLTDDQGGLGYWSGEVALRPYDPPADQSYDELMRRLTDPNEYQRNLERDYLTEQYGEPV